MSKINDLEIIDITSIIDSSSKSPEPSDFFMLRQRKIYNKYNNIKGFSHLYLINRDNYLHKKSYSLNFRVLND